MSKNVPFFVDLFNKIEAVTLVFNPVWANNTGYFDGIVHARLGLSSGTVFKFIDPIGRQVIGVTTRFGNLVMFKRYSEEDSTTISFNCPDIVEKLSMGDLEGDISQNTVFKLLGIAHYDAERAWVSVLARNNVSGVLESIISAYEKENYEYWY